MHPDAIKHAMYYGLILGVVFIANFLLSTFNNEILNVLHLTILCLIPYFCYLITKNYRDKINGGAIGYGQAFWYGIQLFFYAAMVSSAFKFIYFKFLNTNFLKDTFNQSMQLLESMKFPLTDETVEASRMILTPINMSLQYIWINVLVGLFVSLFVAAFVKKEKSIFEN